MMIQGIRENNNPQGKQTKSIKDQHIHDAVLFHEAPSFAQPSPRARRPLPRLSEFIDGAARLRGSAKAIDVWRMETKAVVVVEGDGGFSVDGTGPDRDSRKTRVFFVLWKTPRMGWFEV